MIDPECKSNEQLLFISFRALLRSRRRKKLRFSPKNFESIFDVKKFNLKFFSLSLSPPSRGNGRLGSVELATGLPDGVFSNQKSQFG
jgi:uncharacterized protein (DUF58 family)